MYPKHKEFVIDENNRQVLYVRMISAMLFYNKLTNNFIKYGFNLNSYYSCVSNKMVNGNKMTVS